MYLDSRGNKSIIQAPSTFRASWIHQFQGHTEPWGCEDELCYRHWWWLLKMWPQANHLHSQAFFLIFHWGVEVGEKFATQAVASGETHTRCSKELRTFQSWNFPTTFFLVVNHLVFYDIMVINANSFWSSLNNNNEKTQQAPNFVFRNVTSLWNLKVWSFWD